MKDIIWFRRRWAPWWLAIGAPIFYAPLLYPYFLLFTREPNWRPTTEIRIIMAFVLVGGYWILGVIANWRIAVVRPAGVRISMLPFPIVSGQWVPRESILHCYARHRVDTDDSNSYVIADFYTMGAEISGGHQVDIHLPYATEAGALAAAGDVAQVLNLNNSSRRIGVCSVAMQHTHPWFRRLFLFWGAVTVLAAYVAWRW